MKKLFFLPLLVLPTLLSAQLKVDLQPISSDKFYVECEPIFIRVSWHNTFQEELFVGPEHDPYYSGALSLMVNGQKADKKIVVTNTYAPDNYTLKPGEILFHDFDFSSIYGAPGTYTIKAVVDFSWFRSQKIEGKQPFRFVDQTESNSVEVVIERAKGENLAALVYATKHREYTPYLTDKEQACYYVTSANPKIAPVIFEKFPTSNYAGWILWRLMYHHGQHENAERNVHKPADVVQIVLGKKEFWPKGGERKNLQLYGCENAHNRYMAAMEKLVPALSEGEPWSSVAECLAEEYFCKKQYTKAIPLFKLSKDHPRGKEFLAAIREHMPEYRELIDK